MIERQGLRRLGAIGCVLAVAALLVGGSSADSTPPANDNFAAAQAIAGPFGSISGSIAGATAENACGPGVVPTAGNACEPNHGQPADSTGPNGSGSLSGVPTGCWAGGCAGYPSSSGYPNPALTSVWFTWTTPLAGPVQLTTTGSSFDTVLSVYDLTDSSQPAGFANLTLVAGNNKGCPGGSGGRTCVTFTAVAGQTYWIALDQGETLFGGDAGSNDSYVLNWLQAAALSGAPALSASAGQQTVSGTLSGSPAVYAWTPAAGTITLETTASCELASGLQLEADTVDATGTLAPVSGAEVDGGQASAVSFAANGSTEYYLVVAGASENQGSFCFEAVQTPPVVPLLTLTDTAPATVISGAAYTYTLTGTNSGTADAAGAAIGDTLPTGVTFTTPAGCTAAGQTVTCPVTLPADGGSATVTISATAPTVSSTTQISDSASLSATNASTSTASEITTVAPLPVPASPSVTGEPAASTTSTTATFTFSGDANTTGFLCSLDGASFASCASGVSYTGLATGSHTFQVEATGPGGTSAPASFTWTITSAPATGCSAVGDVQANGTWKATVGRKTANVNVNVTADCDFNYATGTPVLHHAHVAINVDGWPVAIGLDQDGNGFGWGGRVGTVTSVDFLDASDAVVAGTFAGTPFTITLHDGGAGNRNDTVDVQYGALDTSTLSQPHSSVHINVVQPPSPAASTISANPAEIAADGKSTATIVVQTRDASGNKEPIGGATVTLATTLGTIGAVTDNHDGTYTATLTSGTTAGSAVITGTLNGQPIIQAAGVTFVAPPSTSPCNGPGSIYGNENWTMTVGKTTTIVHVDVSGQCLRDKTGRYFLYNGHADVHLNGGGALFNSDESAGSNSSNVSGVTFSGGGTAVVTGTYLGTPFTITLHDGSQGGKNDTAHVQFGSFDTSTLSTAHGNVSVG